MNELMRLAHEFLQNFCLENKQNQASISLKLFGWEETNLSNIRQHPHQHPKNLPSA